MAWEHQIRQNALLKITPNVQLAIVALSLFSGLISAFVDNVATVLMVAPVGLEVARKIKTMGNAKDDDQAVFHINHFSELLTI